MLVNQDSYKVKIQVLKPKITKKEATEIVEKKKTNMFRHFLKKPQKHEVHMHSLELVYEPLMYVSGTYKADYYRKASYPIRVDSNVKEIRLEGGVFEIEEKSSIAKKFHGSKSKNTIHIDLEEHVDVVEKRELCLDHHGIERKFTYSVDVKSLEGYPESILEQNKKKQFEITHAVAIKKLTESLKKDDIDFQEVRDLNEELEIDGIQEVYVPVYEARLIGPKKKVEILRLDGITTKELS